MYIANHGSCLSLPPKGSRLVAVVLGIGTQNYTCSSPHATPTPNGAIATLYDISCPVATVPRAAHYLSALAMEPGVHSGYPVASSMGYQKIGTHYFVPDGAVFEFNSNRKPFKFVGGRLENILAPSSSVKGSVDWLKLGITKGLESQSRNVKVSTELRFVFTFELQFSVPDFFFFFF